MTCTWHRSVFVTAAIALCFSPGRCAWAQAASPTSDAPAADPATLADAKASAPAEDAAQDQAKDARATANAAALTPIVPHPGDARRPAFQLYAEIDLPVLTVGLVFVGARFVRTQKAFCAPLCDRGDLNALDRTTAGYWSPAWSTTSDLGLLAMGLGAGALLTLDEGLVPALNDAVVIAESAMSATAAASVMTLAAGRPRPFLYGDKAPLADRNGSDAGNSFLSSHAAVAFAIATSSFVALHRLHPSSKLPYWVLGAGLGASSFIATARVLAGQHFMTDALGGALVGSAIGVLISSVHPSPLTVVPVVGDTQRGVGVQGAF